ncbi:MAG: hypothetical protein ACXVRH_05295, partial [Thermoleophilaceae bacterium]
MTPAIGVAVAIVAVALALPAGAAAAIPCGNIVVNGGADAGGPSGTDIAAPAGWQATGEFDAV